MSMAKKVTMQQIADLVGVSKFAVSKALSGKSGVSPQTREKIIQAASKLGYFAQKRNRLPGVREALAHKRTAGSRHTVVVLIPNVRYQNRQSVYWGRIIDGVSQALESAHLGMMIVTEQTADRFSQLINPDAVLGLIGIGHITNPLLLEVRNLGLPFVLVDHEDPLIPCDALFMNNYECERRVANYLLGQGHRRQQFVGNIRFSRSFHDRWIGFRSLFEEQQIPLVQDERLLAFEGDNRMEMTGALEPIIRDQAARGTLPTAYVCANDSIAICVTTILMKLGIAVPEQISVFGFDNIDDAALAQPALSTVHVNKEALGRRAVETLLWRINHPDEPKMTMMLAGDLQVRASTAPAPVADRA